MDKFTLQIKEQGFKKIGVSDLGNGKFQNPVIFADYSDPDVIRVGSDFFMTASSFNCSPGLPLLHSKDLVNWTIINNIIDKLPSKAYDKPLYGKGVWAPSIRYHDEKFWVFFPTPDEGIFMTKTSDPFGKWDEPILIKAAKGFIDPCPFWDDDGKAYLINAFAGSRTGFNSILNIFEMKPDGTALLDEGTYVFDGNRNEHHTIEGPKLYKRNGYYYIFAPAGGVPQGWQTVLRSKNIYGPYEDKIVLHQGNTNVNGPHQGGLVELENGESWFMHFQDREEYGRILHLQRVEWIDDWPLIGRDINNDGIGEPEICLNKPDVGHEYSISVPETSDDFKDDKLGLQWQWNANYKASWYSLTEREDHLRLYAVNDMLSGGRTIWHAPNLLLQKFPAPAFEAITKLEFNPASCGERAGLVVSGDICFSLAIYREADGLKIGYFKSYEDDGERKEEKLMEHCIDVKPAILRVKVEMNAQCQFSYSLDGENFENIGCSFKATKTLWMGARTGIFCINENSEPANSYADFDWFMVKENSQGD